MKIFTFNAPNDTRVEILSPLRPQNRDKIFKDFIAETNYTEVDSIQDCEIAIYPQRVFNPETLAFDSSVYKAVEEVKKYNKPLIVDATSDSDTFLNLPTVSILRCGLYRSLKQSFETECPFWSNFRTKNCLDSLEILPKRQKPAIGFCGTTSSMGKLANLTKILSPLKITKLALSEGRFARKIDERIVEGMSLQLRHVILNLLSSDERIDSYFEVTNRYKSYYEKDEINKILLEDLFVENIRRCDYVLCVRGSGNYSGRFYMALNAGRIPVVVDTDIVIPFEEQLNIVKVPTNSIEQTGDFILEHFAKTTAPEFEEMKRKNRNIYHQFIAPEKFLPNFIQKSANRDRNLTVETSKKLVKSIL